MSCHRTLSSGLDPTFKRLLESWIPEWVIDDSGGAIRLFRILKGIFHYPFKDSNDIDN